MKKVNLKGIILPTNRRIRSETARSTDGHFDREIESVGDHADKVDLPNESLRVLQVQHSNPDDTMMEDVNSKRRDKKGLLRSLRRRFAPSFHRKAESTEVSSPDECHCSQVQNLSRAETRKSKQRNRYIFGLCDKSEQAPTPMSNSTENLKSNIPTYMSPTIGEWHSNTGCCDTERCIEKVICWTKDVSRFGHDMYVIGGDGSKQTGEGFHAQTVSSIRKKEVTEASLSRDPLCSVDQTCAFDTEDDGQDAPKVWSLTHELFRLSRFGWYWGPVTRSEAEEKLANQSDGAFLVRDSSDERYLLSLSFRSFGRTLHTRIEHCNGMFSFYAQPDTEGYPSIVDLIEHSMNDSQTGIFCYSRSRSPGAPSFPVRLTKPVSRFTQVRSLQYLCRFVIRQYTRFDHIQDLPLPTTIKGWIEENQY